MQKLLLSPISFLLFLFISTNLFAQNNVQVVRGVITDKVSETPLIGASVVLVGSNPILGTTTDVDGKYKLENVPLGRQTFEVKYIGYSALTVPEVVVTSGKEVVLDVALEESIAKIQEVVVNGNSNKDKPINEYSAVSARTFSLEEVSRYSGGRNDVARLVSNFAGVSTSNDARNDIIVRGNSPSGMLWRLEGIPIPSPNHFSTLGTTGGPVSALNPNLLKTSDFITGAFAAEYGNATAGVFDVGFRNGNASKHEFTLELNAFSGFEGMAEGPLNKAKDASYVVAYRYSFAGIAAKMGIPIGTKAAPQYQDISFKFDLPNSKAGKFSIFGIGGFSTINFIGKELTSEDLFASPTSNSYVKSGFGVLGLKHTIMIGKSAYVKSVVSFATSDALYDQDNNTDSVTPKRVVISRDYNHTLRLSSFYNQKVSAKVNVRAGILGEVYLLNTKNQDREYSTNWVTIRDFVGATALIQPYAQVQYRPTDRITVNGGLHTQFLTLNGRYSIEPRASFAYQVAPRHTLSIAYGWHSQMQALPVYFYKAINADSTTYDNSNRNLDFTRSHHIVLAYDTKIKDDWRIKIEPYVQFITGAPIERTPTSFSELNAGADFVFPDKGFLTNKGIGRNYGIEFTLEKFFSKGYYGLLTASVYDSKYKGSDGIWRNTAFNNRYNINLLLGKEFKVGKDKRHALTADAKFSTSGGKYYTPVDLAASQYFNRDIRADSVAYSQQYPYYLRLDLKLGFRLNSKKHHLSQTFYLDFQNITFRKNVFEQKYNPQTHNLNYSYQIGFFPDVLYKIQF